MKRRRSKYSEEQIAAEACAVLVLGRKQVSSYTKAELRGFLAQPEIYTDFLKFCLERDDSPDLRLFRKGLLFVAQAIGPTVMARATGLTRVTIYRMLSHGGNPRLQNLVAFLRGLKLRVWTVDEHFIRKGK